MNFFVYGTLKEGGHFAGNFDEVRKTCQKAVLKGYDMFGIGPAGMAGYPGIIPGDGEVKGEIHTFDDEKLAEVVRAMDQIEGYDPQDPESSFYMRKKERAILEDGTEKDVMVYVFNRRIPKTYIKIDNGVWDV